jgi:uncharacterized alpha/beta hydrolase family protein
MTDLISSIILFIIITIIVLCVIASINKRTNEDKQIKKYHEKLNYIVPGTLLVRYYNGPDNPFRSKIRSKSSIKILDVKKDTSGEIWISYAYEDILDNTKYMESYPFYDKLEDKLRLYPNIVLPK